MRIETDTINREKTKVLLKAFLFLSVLIFSMVCSAFTVGTQDPSLWVGEKKKLIKVSTVTGQRLLEISENHVEDVAVDNHREFVWVGTRKEIIQYGFDGAEHFRYPLKIEGHSKGKDDDDSDRKEDCLGEDDEEGDATCHGGEHLVRLSLDPFDGSLWIGSKDEVIKIAFDGSERFKFKLSGHVQDISVDPSNGSSWVGLKREVKKYNLEGRSLLSFYLGKGENLQAISVDPLSRSLWIGTKKRVFEVDEQGFEISQDEERTDTQDIAVDTFDPSLWGVGKKNSNYSA